MAAGGASFATGQVFTVGPGRGFCFFVAAASPALCQPLRGKASCRRNVVRTPPRPRRRTVPSNPSASSGRRMLRRLGSCLVIAIRRLLPGEGVGSACLRLRRFRRGGVPCRDLSRLRLRPPSPTPRGTKFLPIRRQPAAARCAHDSPCLPCFRSRRLRRERGSRSVLPICRRQPPRLRSLPIADHASLLLIVGHGMKKAAAVSLLRFTHGRCRSAANGYRRHHRRPTR